MVKVGVLGLQGDVREHVSAVERAGGTPIVVKHAYQLNEVDALILPGGESTTIGKLLDRFELLEPLRDRARDGMPLYGTCAGMILMANEVEDRVDLPHRLDLLDITVRRNAYGRQVDSFEADLQVIRLDSTVRAAFIRAPIVQRVGPDVEVLASFDGKPVLVRQARMLASSFHPEVAGDDRIHSLFLEMVRGN